MGKEDTTTTKNNNDDEMEDTEPTNDDEPEEVWDIIRVIQKGDAAVPCRMDNCTKKSVAIWKSNLDSPDDVWPICEACQLSEFGGWPEGTDPPPSDDDDDDESNEVGTTKDDEVVPTSDGEEEEEAWDIKKIMTMDDLNGCQIKCGTESCRLAAAVLYCSSNGERWFSCLDCQVTDFGGWPESVSDLPVSFMTDEHKALMISKCSKYKKTAMPVFPTSSPQKKGDGAPSQSVTPRPGTNEHKTDAAVITPAENSQKKAPKPSKQHLEMHRKWQAAAEAAGGPGVRIVLSKPVAKKLIFDYLHDAFRPMTITEIYEGLRAIVPSPVLKACLDDMALDQDPESQFFDSDDEDGPPKKKKSNIKDLQNDGFALSFKAGRTSNMTLYWADYNKTKDGNGLDAQDRAKLSGDLAEAESQRQELEFSIKTMAGETKKLLSEPTNEEIVVRLEKEESELAILLEKLDESRQLKVNESHKQNLKARIEHLAGVWRKRRRTCMEFLVSMEEWTDGTVTMKKSLAGEGHLELESDEVVAKGAIEYARNKATSRLSGNKRSRTESSSSKMKPDEAFVALLMNKKGELQRVYSDDAEILATLKV